MYYSDTWWLFLIQKNCLKSILIRFLIENIAACSNFNKFLLIKWIYSLNFANLSGKNVCFLCHRTHIHFNLVVKLNYKFSATYSGYLRFLCYRTSQILYHHLDGFISCIQYTYVVCIYFAYIYGNLDSKWKYFH